MPDTGQLVGGKGDGSQGGFGRQNPFKKGGKRQEPTGGREAMTFSHVLLFCSSSFGSVCCSVYLQGWSRARSIDLSLRATTTQTQLDSSGTTRLLTDTRSGTGTRPPPSDTQRSTAGAPNAQKNKIHLTWKTSGLHRHMWKTKCFNPSIKNNSSNYSIGYINIDP